MEENINLLNEFYLPKVENDFLNNSSAVKILNDNKIDSNELLGIDKDKDAGEVQLTYKDEKEKQADGISFIEGLWEFTKDLPPSTYQSLKLAGVNGADVMINMVPLIDRLFSLDPNYKINQPLMDTMKNWTNHLDVVREEIKAKRDQNQIVAQWVGMIFQDVPYAIPLHKKFKNSGMPKWLAMPLAYGLGYALGFDEEKTSMFLNSKDMQALKSLINITKDTPEDKLFDNVWQAVEGTAFVKVFPELWKGIKFAKRNIPKIHKETITDVSKLAAGGTVLATAATEARSEEKEPITDAEIDEKYGTGSVEKEFERLKKSKATTDAEIDEAYGKGSVEKEMERLSTIKKMKETNKNKVQSDREKVKKMAIESGHPDVFPATDMDFVNLSKLSSNPKTFPATDYDHEVLMNNKVSEDKGNNSISKQTKKK